MMPGGCSNAVYNFESGAVAGRKNRLIQRRIGATSAGIYPRDAQGIIAGRIKPESMAYGGSGWRIAEIKGRFGDTQFWADFYRFIIINRIAVT